MELSPMPEKSRMQAWFKISQIATNCKLSIYNDIMQKN